MEDPSTQPIAYSFKFREEMVGNDSDFNHLFEACMQSRGITHWLSSSVDLYPTFSCIARLRQNNRYSLIASFESELQRYIENADHEVHQSENYRLLWQNLQTVLELLNTEFKDSFQRQQFIFIDEIFLPKQQRQKNQELKPSLKDASYSKGRQFYQIAFQRQFQRFECKVDKAFKLESVIIDPKKKKVFPINTLIKPKLEEVSKQLKKYYSYDYSHPYIRVLTLIFEVKDQNRFLKDEVNSDHPFSNRYYKYNENFAKGRIQVPYREDQSKRNKTIGEKHYSLAFQGGGAKGLAYVGAYKALMENYKINKLKEKQHVPISSIIGSSAGGMIAMAVSTGISYRQMQKICYKMMNIPAKDKIVKDSTSFDGVTSSDVFQSLKAIFHQYGIMHEESFEKVKEIITDNAEFLQKRILKMMEAFNPSIGTIFNTSKDKDNQNPKEDSLNLQGLLVHGALMKGDEIHNIAAECLMRYFLKKYQQTQSSRLFVILDDCFSAYRAKDINDSQINNHSIASQLMNCLQKYHEGSRKILKMPISQLKKKGKVFCQIICIIINSLVLLLTENQEQKESKFDAQDYKYIDQDVVESFKWEIIKKVLSLKSFEKIVQINKEDNIYDQSLDNKEKTYGNVQSLKDLLRLTSVEHKENTRKQFIKLIQNEYSLRLLNCYIFEPSQVNYQGTIQDFIRELCSVKYSDYFDNPQHFDSTIISHTSDKQNKLSAFQLELAEIIIDAFASTQQQPLEIKEFEDNKEEFRKLVATINMLEYYILTSIEFTCTSVDLDDKILRMFNKKTTPFLPVCKAVQMSGSFPGAFKAQKWDKSWGKYTIFYGRHRVQVDLTDHEFTDGGLLANFPVKYLDNQDICKKYFSHIPNQTNTILLGFGLDYLSQYKPNMKQQTEMTKQQNNIATAKDGIGFFNMCKMVISLVVQFLKDRSKDQKKINWSDINHAILQEVPILRFGLKVLNAYPNADRNFNIQTFTNRVIHQNIDQKCKDKYSLFEEEEQIISSYIIKIKNVLKLMAKQKYKPTLEMRQKDLSVYQGGQSQLKQLINKCRKHSQTIKHRLQIKKEVIKCIQKDQTQSVVQHDPWFQERNNDQNKIIPDMVHKLIVIMMMLLRQAPLQMRVTLAKQYISMKYPKSNDKISSPLEYDISQNIKMMVHYLYLRLNKPKLNEQISQKLATRQYQVFYQEAVKNKDRDSNELCFNYHNIVKVFKQIAKKFIESTKKQSQRQKITHNPKIQKWKESFIEFLDKFVISSSSSSEIYLKQQFKQTLYMKNEDLTQRQKQLFLKQKHPHASQHSLASEINPEKTKSVFVYEAQMLYRQKKQQLDQILLKQLCKKPNTYIEKYLSKSENDEIRGFVDQKTKYSLIKLIRALTYYRNDKQYLQKYGHQRFKIYQRLQLQNAILSIFFNPQRTRHELFVELVNELNIIASKQQQETQEYISSISSSKFKEGFEELVAQSYFLKHLEVAFLNFIIAHKIIVNQNSIANFSEKSQELLKKYQHFNEDFQFILVSYKDIIILLSSLSKIMRNKKIRSQNNEFTYEQKLIIAQRMLYNIFQRFVSKYSQLSNGPDNTFNVSTLQQIFIIQYENIKVTIHQVYTPLKYRLMCLLLQEKMFKTQPPSQDQIAIHKTEKTHLKHILHFFQRITYYRASLPLFHIDWKLTLKTQKIYMIQQTSKKRTIKPFQSRLTQAMEFAIGHQKTRPSTSQRYGKQSKRQQFNKLHLILEGVSISNQYFCTYYRLLTQAYKKVRQKQNVSINTNTDIYEENQQKIVGLKSLQSLPTSIRSVEQNEDCIEAITSSNYHAIFGFLLAAQLPFEQIRKETYHLRRLAHTYQNSQKILESFNSFQWLKQCSNQYKQLISYLQKERRQFFDEFQKSKDINYINNSLTAEYNTLKLIVQNQNQRFNQLYGRILDKISQEIEIIDGKINPILKPKEICKKYAFNYLQNLEESTFYAYANVNTQTFNRFTEIVKIFYQTFGSLIEGVLCSMISDYSTIHINENNSALIGKGIIVKRLLNAFRLKEYVMNKLKEMHLSPSITLSKFYEIAPRKILLNFSVINITEQRLEFLNKFTMPYMPVWAAIVSAASLPFIFNYFPVHREWEGVEDRHTFYNLVVDSFFKERSDSKKQISQYCSANYISSLPIQLLTNTTVNEKFMGLKSLREITISFNDVYKSGFESLNISKKFLSLRSFIPLFAKLIWNKIQNTTTLSSIIGWLTGKKKPKNDVSYNSSFMKSLMDVGYIKNTLSTLVQSNDNFIMQWYKDKLIRLPIKLNTLDFHEIVDTQIYYGYYTKVLSEKGKQTIERSYQITKHFTSYLALSEADRQNERYHVKIRVQVLYREDSNQIVFKMFKLTLLNHSKWNRNRFNNFLVYHRVYNPRETHTSFQRAIDSEIQWNIETGSELELLFYFPYFPHLEKSDNRKSIPIFKARTEQSLEQTSIKNFGYQSPSEEEACLFYTNWVINFGQIIQSLNEYSSSGITDADTFDYVFDYSKIEIEPSKVAMLRPVSVKKMNIFCDKFALPKLRVRRIEGTNNSCKKGTAQNYYIKPFTAIKEEGIWP